MTSVYSYIHSTGMGKSSDEVQILLYLSPHPPIQTFRLCSDPSVRKSYTDQIWPSAEFWYVHSPTLYLPDPRSISAAS